MKKIIVSILSLTIFFVLGAVTCFAEPWHGEKADKTQSKIDSGVSQRIKCLRGKEPLQDLEFKSSSEEISCVNDDQSEDTQEKGKHDTETAEYGDPVIMVMNARRDPQGRTQFRNALEDYFKKK